MFLHIMVKHMSSNKIKKKVTIFYVYHDGLEHNLQKKYIICALKTKNIFPKTLNEF